MTCDASKVLSSLQASALETGDRNELAVALARTLKETFVQARAARVWWQEGPSLSIAAAEGDGTSSDEAVRDRLRAAEEGALAREPLGASEERRGRIVVPIRSMGRIIGALDLEAEGADAFGEVDRCVLRAVADSFGGLVGVQDEV